MTDDGSFKGHGGKPGRKPTVISMSAHKNRHNADVGGSSKKLSRLTLFDFSPASAVLDKTDDLSTVLDQALPCENTPFECNSISGDLSSSQASRKSLRWGLEDGGTSEHTGGDQTIFESAGPQQWQHKASRSGSVVESFYHAIHGLQVGFVSQRNVRIHCVIVIAVLALALLLKVDAISCLSLILAGGFVLFAEYINTALEHVTDIQANYHYHQSARWAKDTAAAAVLIAAIAAVLIGAIVFVPRLFALFSGAQL